LYRPRVDLTVAVGGRRVTRSLRFAQATLLLCCLAAVVSCSPSRVYQTNVPPPPTNIRFEVVDQGVKVMWDRVAGAKYYTVFWGVDKGEFRDLADALSNSLVISGLDRGRLYSFAVSSWNEKGESDFSPENVFVFDNEPRNATAHVAKGTELMRQGALVDAYAYLSAAIRLDPDSAEAYRVRALLNEKLDRLESARTDYTMAEKLYNSKPLSSGRSIN